MTTATLAQPIIAKESNQQEKLLLFVMASIQLVHVMDFMIMMPLGPQLMRTFEINPQLFGFLVSAYTFSAGISGFASAFFLDNYDRKKALMFFFTGFTIGTIACGIANTYELLMAARIFTGAFGGVLGALILSVIGDAIPAARRGVAMGVVMSSFSIASIFGIPFGLKLATMVNWQAPFLVLGAMAVLVWILILTVVPAMNGHITLGQKKETPIQVLGNIVKDSNQLRALMTSVLLMFGQFSVIPFLSAYMVANVGFKEENLFYIYLVGGIVSLITAPLVGKMADKYGKQRIFIIFSVLIVIPLFITTNLGHVPIYLALINSGFFFLLTTGRTIPAMTLITGTVAPKHRGSFMSINTCFQQLANAAGSLIGGLIIVRTTAGPIENYNIVGYISIACAIVCLFVGKKLKEVQ